MFLQHSFSFHWEDVTNTMALLGSGVQIKQRQMGEEDEELEFIEIDDEVNKKDKQNGEIQKYAAYPPTPQLEWGLVKQMMFINC